jgi:hypothetical protein
MFYKHLIAILEDHAELMPSGPDGPSTHSHWIIPPKIEPTGQWLENALLLNPYLSDSEAVRNLVNAILEDVSRVITISSRGRSYDALKAILLTLWVSHLVGTPVRYSRRKNDYVRDARYGQVYFKYDRIIPLIDALESRGFIKQRLGWSDDRSGIGRLTRMWGTMRLWNRFRRFGIEDHSAVLPPEPVELIVLRDKKKCEVAYRDTPAIHEQRKQLRAYNDFVKRHSITVDLPAMCEVSNEFLAGWLLNNLLTNRASLIQCILRPATLYTSSHTIPVLPPLQHYPAPHYTTKHSTTLLLSYHHLLLPHHSTPPPLSITDTDSWKATPVLNLHEVGTSDLVFLDYLKNLMFTIASQEDALAAKLMRNQTFLLKDIGVDRLVFRLDSESLHRIYNRRSFSCNGRAYGALHQSLAQGIRSFIRIDERPTIELDYSALHILMLYHREGIDYPDDPYAACTGGEGGELRKAFKTVALVGINAKNPIEAQYAIQSELINKGLEKYADEETIYRMMDTVRTVHRPIAKHVFSDAGIWLQNLDSHIMNGILMRLMERGILGLPVHDSVIVQREHEEVLREIMMREYEIVMGFRPRL